MKYIIEQKVESWVSFNPKIIYDVSEIMDVTADYEILDEFNIIEVDNILVDAAQVRFMVYIVCIIQNADNLKYIKTKLQLYSFLYIILLE